MQYCDLLWAHLKQGIGPKELDWEALIAKATAELVLPALCSCRAENVTGVQIPSEVVDFLSAVQELNLERNGVILAELASVASLLNKIGIEPVVLKGAAYCITGVYPNPAERYLWDVDLLIPEPQFQTAIQALIQNGFDWNRSDRLGMLRHHYPPLQRSGSIFFELHHSLGMGICKSLLPASEVLEQSVGLHFRGARMRVPSATHLMAHLIMHSQIRHPYNERIWPPFRAMLDLSFVQRHFHSAIDWTAIVNRFRKAGQSGVLALHLLQVRETLGVTPPFPIRLTGLLYLRWLRRKLLRASPTLRFFDPIYMYSTVLAARLRLVREALGIRGGWREITSELLAPGIYKRLITDFFQGSGH